MPELWRAQGSDTAYNLAVPPHRCGWGPFGSAEEIPALPLEGPQEASFPVSLLLSRGRFPSGDDTTRHSNRNSVHVGRQPRHDIQTEQQAEEGPSTLKKLGPFHLCGLRGSCVHASPREPWVTFMSLCTSGSNGRRMGSPVKSRSQGFCE